MPSSGADPAPQVPFELLSDAEAWQKMPSATTGGGQPLPSAIKVLAGYAPRTAAALLTLDEVQRNRSPLAPVLRAKMRWVIAHANHCPYSMAYAAFDGQRHGARPEEFASLAEGPASWPEADRAALQFAWQLTVDAPEATDEQFAALVAKYGPQQVAAMVLLAAYGNFQDRLALALRLPLEPNGPLAPLVVKFAADPKQLEFPPHGKSQPAQPLAENLQPTSIPEGWSELSYDVLQQRLEKQRQRQARLPVPTWDEVKAKLPPEYPANQPLEIVWMLICLGYIPELAIPWSAMTRTFWGESQQDRIFEESLFWIQTRTIRCNYCMGHCEMLFEIAGLDKEATDDRIRRLASGDWSSFLPHEQVAYAFARKLTATPWLIDDEDLAALRRELGEQSAFFTVYWLCRGLYMTRISDGFQLPLERDNVFMALFGS